VESQILKENNLTLLGAETSFLDLWTNTVIEELNFLLKKIFKSRYNWLH
jgi:hypothetical protein